MGGLTIRKIKCGFRIDPITGERLPLTPEQEAWGDKMLDGAMLQSVSHPVNTGNLRGRRIKKASLETVEIELPE